MLGDNPKVLIVDDEEIILNSLSRILTQRGYAVHTASNPLDALNYCRMNFYDAIVLDCLLPLKSGLQLAREIKPLQEKNTHFIFISGAYSDPSFINSCLSEVGGSRFYVKPFNASVMVDYLDQVLLGKYKQQTLIEKIYTLPNPSASELLHYLQHNTKIIGYELPFIMAQLSRLKISKLINIYHKDEICFQIRFNKGQIIQLYNFMGTALDKKSELSGIDQIVNDKLYEIQISVPEGVTGHSYISPLEIKSWAEEMTFSFLPLHWVASRLLPAIACKIYSTQDFDVRLKMHTHWPIIDTEGLALENLVGCSLIQKMFSSSRKNEDLFLCLYNYLMNGSAWVDSLKKDYEREGLARFFSWHYNRLAKRNRFEVLELQINQEVEQSPILPIYKRVFKEISDLNISDEINQWIELEVSFLMSCVNVLNSTRERSIYEEELGIRHKKLSQLVGEIYSQLFSSFEHNQVHRLLELIAPLRDFVHLPAELKLLRVWAELKEEGTSYSPFRLKDLRCEIRRLPLAPQFSYIRRINEGLICKLEGNLPVARRMFNEAKKLSPKSLCPEREIRGLNKPESEVPGWLKNTMAYFKSNSKKSFSTLFDINFS